MMKGFVRFAVVFVVAVGISAAATACRPVAAPAPAHTCAGTSVGDVIGQEFTAVGIPGQIPEADAVAYNEDGCGAPTCNASNHCGRFQFAIPLHQDLMNACPFLWHSWADDWCNDWAAAVTVVGQGGWLPDWAGDPGVGR